jgi:hypothetical protein
MTLPPVPAPSSPPLDGALQPKTSAAHDKKARFFLMVPSTNCKEVAATSIVPEN